MARIFKRQGKYWIDFNDAQGVRHRKKVGPDKRIAKEVLDSNLGKVARRVHLGVIEESKINFSDFAEVWKERVFPSITERSRIRWKGILDKHLIPEFKGSLRGITLASVESYRARRNKEGASNATLNLELTVLKHLFNRAVTWEYLQENPIAKVKKFKEPPGRTRWLEPDELKKLLNACSIESFQNEQSHFYSDLVKAYLKPFIIFSLNTGMRRGEVLGLKRKDIDWKNRLVTIEMSKNGQKRHVNLNDQAVNVLKSLPPRIDSEFLFPFNGNQLSIAFKRACKRAEIKDFRLHDLRHCFASYMAMNGVQGRGLQALLGHKDARMTMRYSHLSDEYLKQAVNGIALGVED